MVPMQNFSLKQYRGENRKYNERDGFLHYFQLRDRKIPAADTVGRHLQAVFKKGNSQADQNDRPQSRTFKFQMSVPGGRHK